MFSSLVLLTYYAFFQPFPWGPVGVAILSPIYSALVSAGL